MTGFDPAARPAIAGSDSGRAWAWSPGVLASLLLLLPLVIGDRVAGLFSDSAVYLFMADTFSPWHETSELSRGYFHASRFPPGFPLLLGLLGAGSAAIPWAHVINALLAATGAGLAAVLVRMRAGSNALAVAAGLAVAAMPGLVKLALETASEPLFIVLVLSALIATEREGARPGRWMVVAGLLALAATWTREIGLLFVPLFLVLAFRRRSRVAAAMAVLNLALWLGWHVLRAHDAVSISYGEAAQNALGQVVHDPWAALHLGVTIEAWRALGVLGPASAGGMALLVLALLALPALWSRATRLEPDAWFALGVVAIVVVWPYTTSASRLLAPLLPLVILFAAESIVRLLPRVEAGARPALLAAGVAVLLAAPLLAAPRFVASIAHPVPDDIRDFRGSAAFLDAATPEQGALIAEIHARMTFAATAIVDVVPAGQVVCSPVSEFVALHARRPVVHLPLPKSGTLDPAALARDCPYLFVLGFPRGEEQQVPAYFPLDRAGAAYRPVQLSGLPDALAKGAPPNAFTAGLFHARPDDASARSAQ